MAWLFMRVPTVASFWGGLRIAAFAACGLLLASGGHAAPGFDSGIDSPPYVTELLHRQFDDPRGALTFAKAQLAQARDETTRFWLRIGIASIDDVLDETGDELKIIAAARESMASGRVQGDREKLWLQFRSLDADFDNGAPESYRQRVEALQAAAAAQHDEVLQCHMVRMRAEAAHDAADDAAAWAITEYGERCAQHLGEPNLEAAAVDYRAWMTLRTGDSDAAKPLLEHAMKALEPIQARWHRANIMRNFSWAAERSGEFERSLGLQNEYLETLRALGIEGSQARALKDRARIELAVGDAAGALRDAREAVRLSQPPRPQFVWVQAQAILVRALAALRDPGLSDALATLARVDTKAYSKGEQALIARAEAEGYDATGDERLAYRDLRLAMDLQTHLDAEAHAANVRLRAIRYDLALRDAENRELREKAEAGRLEITAKEAQYRLAVGSMIGLGALLFAATAFSWQVVRSRRRAAELASRDELTGQPNRRAILSYARQQLTFSRTVQVPLSLAIIDLDHFKSVNDTYGHAAGDAVLKAFAKSASRVLRAQDRLGRFGGEEWLLVLPGTRLADVEGAFRRLRKEFADQPIEGLPMPHGVTFSLGGAAPATEDDALEAILARADSCLYAAKRGGRDACRLDPQASPEALAAQQALRVMTRISGSAPR